MAKRKPSADDPLRYFLKICFFLYLKIDLILSTKAAFILMKHQKLAYAFRQNNEDGMLSVENELGKQLHASVRTNNTEVSFRLLTQGADPNYFHDVNL